MFLQIVFCFSLLIVGIDSADDACKGPLSAFIKEIRSALTVYKDAKTGQQYCFFRLSEADEKASITPDTSNNEWVWNKPEAVKKCGKYKAVLPLLKDPAITDFFMTHTKPRVNASISVLLGVNKVEENVNKVKIHWNDNTILEIDLTKGVHGKPAHKFTLNSTIDAKRKCQNNVDVTPDDGGWACLEPTSDKIFPGLFCQLSIAATPGTATPKGVPTGAAIPSIIGQILKLIVLATTVLVIGE